MAIRRGGDGPRGKDGSVDQLRRSMHAVLEGGLRGYLPGRVFNVGLLVVIVASVASVVMDTVRGMPHWVYALFEDIEAVSVWLFTAEYLLRVWVAIDEPHGRFRRPLAGRLRYLVTPMALIDLLAVVPYWLGHLIAGDPSVAVLLRVLRLFKMVRFSGAFEMIGAVLTRERRSLLACASVVAIILVLLATLAYLTEHDAQPDKFGSIPAAMYWGLVTLTTVGYGDLAPITPLGRVVGGIGVVLGVLCFAMPAGILASGFIEEVRRRDFIVTWQLVAKVPLFARLSAARIASIAGLLRYERIEAGELIVRKGETADCMYFVLSGEIEVSTAGGPVHLGAGDYFGEAGLIEHSTRNADVRARTECALLVLMERDFWMLLEAQPELGAEVRAHVERRRPPTVVAPLPAREGPGRESPPAREA
jgi:voltage-gated potassium channel